MACSNIYIMTNTEWHNVNIAVLQELPNPDLIVILVPLSESELKDGNLRNHRERQAMNFKRAWHLVLLERQVQEKPKVKVIVKPLEGIEHWRKAIVDCLKDIETGAARNASVTFSYISGPSQVKIGCWLGLDDLARQRPDLTIRRAAYEATGHLRFYDSSGEEPKKEIRQDMSPEVWLAARGFHEYEEAREKRHKNEEDARKFAKTTRELGKLCFESYHTIGLGSGWLANVLRELRAHQTRPVTYRLDQVTRKASALKRRENPEALDTGLTRLVTILGGLTERFPGVELNKQDSSLTVPKKSASGLGTWLTGGWFEEFIYLLMTDRVGKDALRLNMELRAEGLDDEESKILKDNSARELDIVVMGKSQMHVIECKASGYGYSKASGLEKPGKWREQCVGIRKDMIGPRGRIHLFSTNYFARNNVTRKFFEMQGITLASNLAEIKAACDRLAADIRP